MVAEGHTVASLTGGIEGSQRDAVIDAFRTGEAKVLITTNVLARGIDVSTVSLVVNYVCSPGSCHRFKLTLLSRIFRRLTRAARAPGNPITKPIFTVSVVPVVSVASVWPFPSSPTATNGRCCGRFSSTSTAALSASRPTTGTRLRTSSNGHSKIRARKPTSSRRETCMSINAL